ncbi:MAG TPA: HAMP domain-containing sensor histidine kinase [Gemmatimonadaceae bacterium]|nr:HAMP domain-containing sensor histidine kinase [Gemmatimonadaceae bacterium]
MPFLSLPRVRQPRLVLLVALLVLSFVATAILAYQAQDAARSHRVAAERALRDYADFAAMNFAVHTKEGLYNTITSVLYQPGDMGLGAPTAYMLPKSVVRRAADHKTFCNGKLVDSTLFFFRLELREERISRERGCVPGAVRAWLIDTVKTHSRHSHKRAQEYATLVGPVNDVPYLITYTLKRDTSGAPTTAFGFATPFIPFAKPTFKDVAHSWLLPPSLIGDVKNDSVLSVRVTDKTGRLLYQSSIQYPPSITGQMPFPETFGGMHFTVALRPEAATKLVIGGLPRSRLPVLLGLLAVCGTLVVVALLQLRREYELARLRSDFISSISHELRTPLAQVRMFAETLLLGRVRSEQEARRSLEIIDQEARRLTHLVENVLQFSRAERNLSRLTPEPTDIPEHIRETVESFTPIAAARQVQVRLDIGECVTATVDRGALRQTLLNLLDNAVKYGPAGQSVTVGVARVADAVRIWVEDMGPGITEKERDRIWEPFYRLNRDANSAVAGSGIGLSVVRGLIRQHGGSVWVEDALGGGARFVVELPGASSRSVEQPANAPSNGPATTDDIGMIATRSETSGARRAP